MIAEYWRGGLASALFLMGAPLTNARIALRARDTNHAREMISRHFARFIERCRVRVSLEGHFPEPGQGCILSHNETSFIDVAAYCMSMWPYAERAAAADLYKYIPGGRAACRKLAIELVPRGNRDGTDRLLDRMVEAVRRGERVVWGGEGRISGVDGVARFKVGASLIAIRAKAPVIPVVMHGGHHVMPLGSFRARPGEVRIRFCEPVSPEGYTEADARGFADHLQGISARTYQELAEKRPAKA